MKVVFDTRPSSGYDDSVERYHFPRQYLALAERCVGNWVVASRSGKVAGEPTSRSQGWRGSSPIPCGPGTATP